MGLLYHPQRYNYKWNHYENIVGSEALHEQAIETGFCKRSSKLPPPRLKNCLNRDFVRRMGWIERIFVHLQKITYRS